MTSIVQQAAPAWLRFIDYNRMGQLRQQNVRDTHGDTFLQLQVLTIMLNTIMAPAAAVALAGCARTLSVERSCSLDSVGDSVPCGGRTHDGHSRCGCSAEGAASVLLIYIYVTPYIYIYI